MGNCFLRWGEIVEQVKRLLQDEVVVFIDKASTNHWNCWGYSKNWVIVWGLSYQLAYQPPYTMPLIEALPKSDAL